VEASFPAYEYPSGPMVAANPSSNPLTFFRYVESMNPVGQRTAGPSQQLYVTYLKAKSLCAGDVGYSSMKPAMYLLCGIVAAAAILVAVPFKNPLRDTSAFILFPLMTRR
jgi:hypothetical protein